MNKAGTPFIAYDAFNRTSMESKHCLRDNKDKMCRSTFNRTSMESKPQDTPHTDANRLNF